MSLEDEVEDKLLEGIVNSAKQIGFKATRRNKNNLTEFYNQKVETCLSNANTGDIFESHDFYLLLDAYIYAKLAGCSDDEKCKKISKKIINKVFNKINNKK